MITPDERPTKIISGGQTGADQGALRAGYVLGIPTGGWMPKGYRTEHGPQPWLRRYGVQEMPTVSYRARTVRNLMEADGTIVFGNCENGGTRLTLRLLRAAGKPLLINPGPPQIRRWTAAHQIRTVNVAGNRETGNRGIEEYVFATLLMAWGEGEVQIPSIVAFPVLDPIPVVEEGV